MRVLVTGGAGYIGSHTSIELLAAGHEVCIIDNLCNGHVEVIDHIARLSNKEFNFYECDIRDTENLDKIFYEFKPDTVLHFAGLKAVGESVNYPLKYFDVNVSGSVTLLAAMNRACCSRIVFSSSATVYGIPDYMPYDESHPTNPINPYGRTKLMVENILQDWSAVDCGKQAISLRYFNPVGAHPSTLIGEDPLGIPNNLMPYISQVAIGRQDFLKVFGDDYNTLDGTGVRDYIHVVDLALAHVKAVEKQESLDKFEVINLGSGKGTSVLELIKEFEAASNVNIPIKFYPRRDGDLPVCWTNPQLAFEKLDWKTKFDITEMCKHTWEWQRNNPNGFVEKKD
ncbi:UDP-glucose 4-epimerase GalE [Amylibacter sp.]|nr:UDP-glucose 4-epimerase GalE [Amylibacter sp.]